MRQLYKKLTPLTFSFHVPPRRENFYTLYRVIVVNFLLLGPAAWIFPPLFYILTTILSLYFLIGSVPETCAANGNHLSTTVSKRPVSNRNHTREEDTYNKNRQTREKTWTTEANSLKRKKFGKIKRLLLQVPWKTRFLGPQKPLFKWVSSILSSFLIPSS